MTIAIGSPLWIVDPSLRDPETQGAEEIAARWNGPTRLFLPALRAGDGPDASTDDECAAAVVMGSAASVHDRDDWLDGLSAWLRPIVTGRRRLPLLGICFGHQLIAHLAGASIGWLDPTDRHKRVGVETTRVTSLTNGASPTALRVVVSHREVVDTVPGGFEVVGERDGCEIDGLAHRRLPIISYQFHPEAREEFAGRAGFEPSMIDAGVVSDSRRVLDAFVELARGERAG